MPIAPRPGPGRGPARGVAGFVVGGTLPVFFTPFFLCSRRWLLRKFVLAVLMHLVSMLMEGVVASSLVATAGSGRVMLRGSRVEPTRDWKREFILHL